MYSRVHRSGAPDTPLTHTTTDDTCQDNLKYGRDEDPAKSTYSILALIERGLGVGWAGATQ